MDLVIGAGISGLSYAAFSKNDCLIVEKDPLMGGYCRTVREKDYVWDYSGHFFHFQRPEIKDFVMERIPAEDILNVVKHTQIYYKGKLVDYPFQMNIHQLDKEEFVDCLYDLFTAENGGKTDTFKKMLYAKFGKSIAEKFLIPYNEKLYATDLDNLDTDAMGRFFPYADKEQIVRNFRNSENRSYNATFLYPKYGAEKIVDSIASRIDPEKICLNEELLSVDTPTGTAHTNKRTIKFDNLVSTVPFPTLLRKCGIDFDESAYTCNKVLVFNLGFDKKGRERKNNWIYFPDPELVFYRVGFYDNIIGQDKMSLYVEIGFNQLEKTIDIENYRQKVLSDLKKVGILNNEHLVAEHHVVMEPAYVHITQQSETDKNEKKKLLAANNIYSIGRYGSWTYCSLEDNIYEALELAKRLS
ncbi:MAG: NAD(P)-binding protein [Bacteroidales bacterium]|nr:NAD(P)-binding protein [Bacteroidales bacterium]